MDLKRIEDERLFGPDAPAAEAPEEVRRRRQVESDFASVFMAHPRGKAVLAEIARICKFNSPARSVEDMALQNAFKTILHRLGRWNDDIKGADDLVERLLGA
jgi:hypothetical protein